MADTKVYLSGGRIQGASTDATGAVDSLGTAVNGTNDGSFTNASTPINGQTSVEFDDNDYGKDMGTTSSFATLVGSSWSISFWLHYNGVSGNGWGAGDGTSNLGILVTTGQISSTGNGFVIGLDDNSTQKFYLLIASGQGTSGRSFDDVFTDAIAIHGDKWHHYVFNFDNTNDELKIYRDGSLVQTIAYANTIPTPSATTTSALAMGRQGESNIRYFKGELADVGIFNRLLTTGEMTYLFNSFDPDSATASDNTGKEISTMTNQAGLLANYKLDNVNFTNSAVATDESKTGITDVPIGTRYEETDTRKIFTRAGGTNVGEWLGVGETPTHNILRGLVGGGGADSSELNTIDYITIASAGNALDFGDLTAARFYAGALADSTRGLWGGGMVAGDAYSDIIDYVIVATAGNATDFGDLSQSRRGSAGLADATRGCWGGGYNSNIGNDAADYAEHIDYVTIQTTGNATTFGVLTVGRENVSSLADKTRGVWAGGHNVSDESNVMDYVTIATTGNATDFGDLLTTNNGCRGVSNNTRGCWMGHGHSVTNVIQYITIQTTGNATDFGDLTVARRSGGAMADLTRGVLAGGHPSTDTIDYITIDTTGNATDFGNLTSARISLNGCAA